MHDAPPTPDPLSGPATWMRHAMGARILGSVVSAMRDAGVDVLPVKGIVTSHTLYADSADRPMGDIDLRVRIRDFHGALRVAEARGWAPFADTPRLWEAGMLVDGWEVELESTVGPPGLCALRVDELIERANRQVAPFGFEHLEPELHDHALVLCINAFKDALRVTPWALEDLTRIGTDARFDAASLVERARRGRVTNAVWLVADWLARARDARGWREVRARIGAQPPRPWYARWFRSLERRPLHPKLGLLAIPIGGDRLRDAVPAAGLATVGALRGAVLRRVRVGPR